jgi:hypothetical protein
MQSETVESRALAIRENNAGAVAIGESKPLKYSLPELRQVGEIMFQSGMFRDLKSVQQAMVKLLAGAELGYGPFQSLRAFHVIEGKPVETSGEITARIKRSGKYRLESYFIDATGTHLDPIKTKANETNACVVRIFERLDGGWHELEPTVFAKEDAAQAGLLGKDVWKKYLRDMLFARALTAAARRHCADIFGGPIYGPEEFGAEVTIDGNGEQVIVSQATVTALTTPPEKPADPKGQRGDDTEASRESGRKAVMAFATQNAIPDEWRHELSMAFCGAASTKDLDTAGLRRLYKWLTNLDKARAGEEWSADTFAAWLQYSVDEAAAE